MIRVRIDKLILEKKIRRMTLSEPRPYKNVQRKQRVHTTKQEEKYMHDMHGVIFINVRCSFLDLC